MGDEIMGSLGLFPKVGGTCPACGNHTLFLGEGGWPTCGYLPCPDPTMTCADQVAALRARAEKAELFGERMQDRALAAEAERDAAREQVEQLRALLVEANDAFDEATGDYPKELVEGEAWRAYRTVEVETIDAPALRGYTEGNQT